MPFTATFRLKRITYSNGTGIRRSNWYVSIIPRLHVPDVKPFHEVAEALEFLKSTEQLWVLKGQDDSVKTFVPDVDDPNSLPDRSSRS
jgi:hypothetical protein